MNRDRPHHTGRDVAPFALPLLRGEPAPRIAEGDSQRIAEGLRRAGLTTVALRALGEDAVPAALKASLERERNRQRAELALLYDRLARFCDLMAETGVRFIVHKGASLATLLYDSPEMRPMVDVDVVIRRGDWPAAREALRRVGYRVPTEAEEAYWLANYFNMAVSSPDAQHAAFDIHWALNQEIRYQVDEEGLWARAVPFQLEGRSYLRLGNEDLLLSLVLHMAYHYFEARLLWLYDLHRLCLKVPLDWGAAMERARRWRMSTVLGLALGYVEKAFPGTVPEGVLRETAPRAVRRLLLAPLRSGEPARLFRGDDRRLVQLVQGLLVMDSPLGAARFGADKVMRRLRFLGARPRLR
jgi:hypothetical protein